MTKDIKPPRLTRAQIAEGLESVPLDTILLGTRTETRLTAKQKAFARSLALGNSKAQAYRETYSDKGTKKTQAATGWKMAQRPDIVQIKEAYELAIEAAKQRTPAQLRELVIHQLTQHALDTEVPPAQRIQALKLLGTVSEVAAFTERKEVTQVKRSEDVRAALMEKLRAITGSAVEGEIVDAHDADSLLEEIREGTAQNDDENASSTHTIDAGATNESEGRLGYCQKTNALESDCEGLITKSYSSDDEVSENTGFNPAGITKSYIASSSGDNAASVDPTHAPPPTGTVDHLGTSLHSIPLSQPQVESIPLSHSPLESTPPVFQKKAPADTPTPSDMEMPPGRSICK